MQAAHSGFCPMQSISLCVEQFCCNSVAPRAIYYPCLSFPPQPRSLIREEARVFFLCLFAAAFIQFRGVYLSAPWWRCLKEKRAFFYTRLIKSFASNMAIVKCIPNDFFVLSLIIIFLLPLFCHVTRLINLK